MNRTCDLPIENHTLSKSRVSDTRVSGRATEESSGWFPKLRETVSPEALLLKSVDAARALQIGTRTLWSLTKRGEVRCIKVGRSVRYDPRDLQTWIDRQKEANGTGQATA